MSLTDELEKLGESDVRRRLANEGFGTVGNPTYLSVQEWLRVKELEREDSLNARREAREEETLSISRKALRTSYAAIIIAIMAIVFPIIVILCTKK